MTAIRNASQQSTRMFRLRQRPRMGGGSESLCCRIGERGSDKQFPPPNRDRLTGKEHPISSQPHLYHPTPR